MLPYCQHSVTRNALIPALTKQLIYNIFILGSVSLYSGKSVEYIIAIARHLGPPEQHKICPNMDIASQKIIIRQLCICASVITAGSSYLQSKVGRCLRNKSVATTRSHRLTICNNTNPQ